MITSDSVEKGMVISQTVTPGGKAQPEQPFNHGK